MMKSKEKKICKGCKKSGCAGDWEYAYECAMEKMEEDVTRYRNGLKETIRLIEAGPTDYALDVARRTLYCDWCFKK